MIHKLAKRIYLLLVEKGDEVVTETAHLAVSVVNQLFLKPWLVSLFQVFQMTQFLKLLISLCEMPFAGVLFVDLNNKRPFAIRLCVVTTGSRKKQGNLKNLNQNTTKKEFHTVLWHVSWNLTRLISVLIRLNFV